MNKNIQIINVFFKLFNRWKEVIIMVTLIRIILFIFPLFFNSNLNELFTRWVKWDGPHYLEIAKNGYQTIGEPALFIVFYPLYPLLIWLSHFVISDFQTAAILLSTFFSFTASIALFELTLMDFNRKTAILAVWFLNIFPTAYFLQSAYTESLFLTVSLLTVFFYRKRIFFQSGLAGALASLTRVNGILLLPILLMETKNLGKNLITLLLIPLGFSVYLIINYLTFGEPFYFSKVLSSHWYKQFAWPWTSIQNLINFYQSQTGDYYWLFLTELITIFLLFITTIFVYLKIRKSYGIYMFCNLLLFTSTSFIMSTPRYALILFPIYIGLALIKNKLILTIISIIFLVLLFTLANLYIQWRWAF